MGCGEVNSNQVTKSSGIGKPKTLTEEQERIIATQQEKSLCQITVDGYQANGFLCKIHGITNPVLITNNHVLDENKIVPGSEINIYFTDELGNRDYKTIKIDEDRTVYTVGAIDGENIDTTIIELRPDEDNLNDKEFLQIDRKLIMGQNVKSAYKLKDIYVIFYERGENVAKSTGKIVDLTENEKSHTLYHKSYTINGTSGCPVLLYNHKVIGVNRAYLNIQDCYSATLLQYPIKEYKKIIKKKLAEQEENNINGDQNDINGDKNAINGDKNANNGDKNANNGDKNANNGGKNENSINKSKIEDFIDKLTISYSISNEKKIKLKNNKKNDRIKIFGKEFVQNNKQNCNIIINKKKYKLCEYIMYDKFGINKNDDSLTIVLTGINDVIYMGGIFNGCRSLLSFPDIPRWNTENVTNMSMMFVDCNLLQAIPDISRWNTENVMDMGGMFCGCNNLQSLPDISKWKTENVTSMDGMFDGCNSLVLIPDISKWNTENVTNMGGMFGGCNSLHILPDISKWDTKNVTIMDGMFCGCNNLTSLPDISRWDTKNVKNMNMMFNECINLKSLPDISKWVTKNVTNMSKMFYRCSCLKSVPDISKWNTKNVKNMVDMFGGCKSLDSLPDISKC